MVLFEVRPEGLLQKHRELEATGASSVLFYLDREEDFVLFLPGRGFVLFALVRKPVGERELVMWRSQHLGGAVEVLRVLGGGLVSASEVVVSRGVFDESVGD